MKSKITKNLFSLTFGQGFAFILNFIAILLAARFLGVENFGSFTTLLAVISIISKFIDFGLVPIVFREQSKDSNNYLILNNSISIRIILSILFLIVLNVILLILDYNNYEIILANALYANIFLSQRMANFRELLSTPFKVNLSMHYPMAFSILENLLLVILVLFTPFFDNKLTYFITIYIASCLPSFILMLYYLRKKVNFNFHFDLSAYKWLIKESIPIAGFVILMVIFQQIDILILKEVKGVYDSGIFAAATRITLPLNIIPSTIITTVFPIIVSNININKDSKNKIIVKLVYKILFVSSFIVFIFYSFKSIEFTKLLFGTEYLDSALPTVIMLLSQVILFFNFFSLDLFTANNLQKWNFIYAIILVVTNIIFAVYLIPHFGFNGAAFAKLIVSGISLIFIITILNRKSIYYSLFDSRLIIWTILISLFLMLLSFLNIFIYFVMGSIVILILTLLVPFWSNAEIKFILKTINQVKLEKFLKNNLYTIFNKNV